MTQTHLILASSSPQRQRLLSEAGYRFDVVPPHGSAESGICSNCGPAELVLDLAAKKAASAVSQLQGRRQAPDPAWVLACDTVAECNGQILGKPTDEQHARQMLQSLRGELHRVFTGVCLWPWQLDGAAPHPHFRVAVTQLRMERLSDDAIDEYLATSLWQGKAGAFGLQDRPGWFKIVHGSESNVIGLPLETLAHMLAEIEAAE